MTCVVVIAALRKQARRCRESGQTSNHRHTSHGVAAAGHQQEARQVSSSSDVNTPVSAWHPACSSISSYLDLCFCRLIGLGLSIALELVPATGAAAAPIDNSRSSCTQPNVQHSTITASNPHHHANPTSCAATSVAMHARLAQAHGMALPPGVQPTLRQHWQQQTRQQQQCVSPPR
jgi:hypothetical protein